MTATEEWLEGTGGKVFARQWEPSGSPRASIVICPGFNAHSGHYEGAAEVFTGHGYAVTAVDLRGRGQSEGERFYVERIDDYVADLDLAVDLAHRAHPGLPLVLLGHSAGGVVAVTYALDHQDRINALVCESFAFKVPAPDLALKLLEGASHVIPHAHVLKLKMEDFSRDPAWVEALEGDPLVAGESQPAATVAALARADERLDRDFGAITVPLLILHGSADRATRHEGSEQFFRDAGSADKTLKIYQGHVHDLLNDRGKEEVLADILAWIDTHALAGQDLRATLPPVGA